MKLLFFIAIAISTVSMTAMASNENCPLRFNNKVLLSDKAPQQEYAPAGDATQTAQPVNTHK